MFYVFGIIIGKYIVTHSTSVYCKWNVNTLYINDDDTLVWSIYSTLICPMFSYNMLLYDKLINVSGYLIIMLQLNSVIKSI